MAATLNIGVIGMGWMGQAHSRSYINVPLRFPEAGIRPNLVICSDNVAARADSARDTLGFRQSTTRWQDVIEHPDVQVVNICTPNDLHVEIVRAAAAAGKHIFCEKPVGRTPHETAQAEAAAREAGIISGVGFNYRWVPLVQHARHLLESGSIGPLELWRGRFFSMYGANPLGLLTWRFDKNIAGSGVLGDLMSHVVDMTLFLAGRITRVVGQNHTFIKERPIPIPGKGTHYGTGGADDPKGPVGNEDYAGALVEFESGAIGSLEACRTVVGPKSNFTFDANCTQGALGWNFERMNELSLYQRDAQHDGFVTLLSGDKYPYHGNFVPGDGNPIGYEDLKVIEAFKFLESVAAGQQHSVGLREALAVAEVNAAMERSWSSGTWEAVTPLL
jgi:predicted dehydrogenase